MDDLQNAADKIELTVTRLQDHLNRVSESVKICEDMRREDGELRRRVKEKLEPSLPPGGRAYKRP